MGSDVFSEGSFHRRDEVHILRKVFHVVLGLTFFGVYLHLLTREQSMYACFVLAFFAFSVELLRLRVPKINKLMVAFFGPFMRRSELSSLSGLPFYSLGAGLALLFYETPIMELAALFLIFSDPISSYFGIRYGTSKIVGTKSIQGSAAGFCTCYLISLIYGLVHAEPTINLLLFSLFSGLVGSLSELLSIFVDDNLTIPVASGAGLTVLNMIFSIY